MDLFGNNGGNMSYCPPNVTLSQVWVNGSISNCFLDTVTTSVFGSFIVIFGIGQLLLYRKFATRLMQAQVPNNFLFNLQAFVHLSLTCLGLLEVIVRHTDLFDPVISLYGYQILYLTFQTITWPLCFAVVMAERHYQLPTPPSRGHGFVLLLTWTGTFMTENLALLSLNKNEWWFDLSSIQHRMEFGFWISRYILTLAAFCLGLKAPGISSSRDYVLYTDDDDDLDEETQRRSSSEGSTWRNFWKKICTLLPYMWPKGSIYLQLRVLFCVSCLAAVRVTNVFVPIYYKKIVDHLSVGLTGPVIFPWQMILIYVALKFLQGGGSGGQGVLNNLRSFVWIPVQQYTTREIQVKLFSHLHGLSLRWHLGRKTGEVLVVMNRGTTSINTLLSYLVFNIVPTISDIVIAVVYFTSQFNVWFGLIVFVTMACYLGCTILFTEWRTKFRRSMNTADNEQRSKAVDSILNFETVKYYGTEEYETQRYRGAILDYQKQEWKSLATLALLNSIQSTVMNLGLMAGLLYCGYLTSHRELTVGDFVLFGTYILQLMVPLNFLGTLYQVIQEAFVNMENMLDLMQEDPEVKDIPGAVDIIESHGKIEFNNVSFYYSPERLILKNVSFKVNPGETVALVGPTGSGKSTIIRLLFRFYDIKSGQITIDDQNIKTLTQSSIRKLMGVVPQDTILFNETIRYNIHYGRTDSTIEEVEEAAKMAGIHDNILTFPEGYETKVGERGLKLSGGEKQRVAIARTLLKAPEIVLLDEATSALDTKTERLIQNSLNNVTKNRTTIVVAHRLSTIVGANVILVMKDGEIAERGSHEQLLAEDGIYASMWKEQATSDDINGNQDDVVAVAE